MSRQRTFGAKRDSSAGFVNVEFLVILTILVVVAGVAVFFVLTFLAPGHRPPEARWYQEVGKLYAGIEAFRERFNRTPPNFDDKDQVARFVAKAFPQYKAGVSTPYPEDLDAARALVFWLDEISTDPTDPFARNARERFKFFEFPAARVRDGRFYPTGDDDSPPYVYFEYTSYDRVEFQGLRPYFRSQQGRVKEYLAPETAQIIAPGGDNDFGRGGLIADISEADRDNIVSFDTRRVGDIEADDDQSR